VRTFTDEEWERVIAVVASKIAHAAALRRRTGGCYFSSAEPYNA